MRGTIIVFCLTLSVVFGRQGFGPTDQEWGYVDVRPNAHMFWWLHYTTANVTTHNKRPLLIWVQGGPGGSSTGFGNFGEIGPLDDLLQPRKNAWTKLANVLFIDNPVGTGYSYTDDPSGYATNNKQIAKDFLAVLQGFYKKLPEFSKTPLYIFSESYGGKMTADIALTIHKAVEDKTIDCNLVGIGLGDSWISPIDSVSTWGPYLYNLGIVDKEGLNAIQEIANETIAALDSGDSNYATTLWNVAESTVEINGGNVDFYNVLTKIDGYGVYRHDERLSDPIDVTRIYKLMNNEVKTALNISVSWGDQADEVFGHLRTDFMLPVTDVVETLLNTTNLKVAVYNGQLDLIVDTPGTVAWVERLKWPGAVRWNSVSSHKNLVVNNILEGFLKKADNLAFYWVLRAGHMVPSDNTAAMRYILNDLTDNFEV